MTLDKFFGKDCPWGKDLFKQVNGMFTMNISTKDAWLKNPYKQGKKWLAGCSIIAVALAIVELLYHKLYNVPMFDDWLCFALPIFFFVNGLIGWFWGFYFTPSKPRWMSIVNLNRHLFSKSGWSMLVAALVVTIVIIGLLSLLILLIKSSLPDQEVVESDVFDEKSSFWFVIRHFMDAGNITSERNSDWAYALFCAFIGIFILSGFTVSSFVNIISKKSDNWKKGLIHYNRTFDNYVVIIGCNEQTANLVRNSLNKTIDNKKVRFVLIQTRQDVEKAREALELKLNAEEEKWLVFYSGERTSKEDIAALHLEKALEVFVLGEDMHIENEKDHDTYNINCLQLISEYIKSFKKINAGENNLRCHVNLEYQSTYAVFKSINLYKVNKRLEFLPFNVNEIWAKKLLVDNCAVVPAENGTRRVEYYLPLDYRGIDESSTRTVHLFVIGMNQMGTALATQAALLAHYPNFCKDSKYRTTITFIDDNAVKEGEFYRGRYAQLFALCRYRTMTAGEVGRRDAIKWIDPIRDVNQDFEYQHTFKESNFLDIQWEFIQGNVASDEIKEYMQEVACDSDKECTIAVCYTDPQKSVATAVYLPEKLLKKVNQVLVYQPNKFELVNMASSSDLEWKRYEKLRPFGMIEDCYTSNMFEDVGPRLAQGMFLDDKLLGNLLDNIDISNIDEHIRELKRHWNELDMSNRLSSINMIDSIATKIRSLGGVSEKDLEGLNFTGKARFLRIYSDGQYRDNDKDKEIQTRLKENLVSLSKTEHTRWLTERLIIGYRPVNAKEYEELQKLKDDKTSFVNKKEYFENKYKAHLDICSNEVLNANDRFLKKGNLSNDEMFVTNIPKLKNAKSLILSRLSLRERKHSVRSFYENKYDEDGLTRRILQKMKFVDLTDNHMKFWICSEVVSVGLWNEVMRDGNRGENPKLPKTGVSKEDAENFIRILNNKTGLCFRLPTRKEWSYAAIRNSEGYVAMPNKFFDNPTGSKKVCNAENERKLLAVKKRGYRGKNDLYHMAGNVWEWTSSQLVHNAERSFYYCGGSYKYSDVECKIQIREIMNDKKQDPNNNWYNYGLSDFCSEDLGFRLVLSHDFDQNSLKKEISKSTNVEIKEIIDELFRNVIGVASNAENNNPTPNPNPNADDRKLNGIGRMVYISQMPNDEHKYCMGTNDKLPEESPAHFVKLRASRLFVGSYLVTQKLWKMIMDGNPSSHKGDNNPVENVSYEDIQKFLEKLNDNLKQSNFYKDNFYNFKGWKFRLPTETEWEFIAKGGANYRNDVPSSCTADDFSKSYHKYSGKDENDNCDEVAWHYKLTKTTHQVGKKKGCLVVEQTTIDEKWEEERNKPNHESYDDFLGRFMVFDMCGNVWEWCEDDYDADAYTKVIKYDENGKATIEILDAKSTAHNTPRYVGIFYPKEKSFVHSVRGGSFKCLPEECRVTRVSRRLSDQRFDDLGFRLIFAECDFIEEIRKANKKLDAQKKRKNNNKRKVKESENEQDKE